MVVFINNLCMNHWKIAQVRVVVGLQKFTLALAQLR